MPGADHSLKYLHSILHTHLPPWSSKLFESDFWEGQTMSLIQLEGKLTSCNTFAVSMNMRKLQWILDSSILHYV